MKKKCISFIPSLRGLFSPSSREANWEAKMVLLVTKWINKSATRVRSSIIRYENTDSSVTTVPSCLGAVSRPCRHTRLHTLPHCSRRSNLCTSCALAHSSKTIHSRYSCGWEQNPKSLANLKQSYIILTSFAVYGEDHVIIILTQRHK